ncbi:MAG: HAD-IA family hydrolase [Solobacterium sp.]|nr:HAD-IA family hydrolase [Solobacterium sp.]
MIKGIFFDLGWTLMKPETGDWMLTKKFRKYYPLSVQNKVDSKVWNQALALASQPLIDHHLMSTREEELEAFTNFYYDLCSHASLSITKEIAREIAYDRTYHYEKYVMLDGARELLETLHSMHIKTSILSDTWPSMVNIIQELGYEDLFDSYTYSYQYGVYKPNPILLEAALKNMDLPPEECMFMDDLEENIIAMEKYGVHPILSCAKNPSFVHPTIPCAKEPLDILEFIKLL